MGKKKRKAFWGEDMMSDLDQRDGIDALIHLSRQVEMGGELPNIHLDDVDDVGAIGLYTDVEDGLLHAVERLGAKVNMGEVPDENFSPLVKVSDAPPVTERIFGEETSNVIRDMEKIPVEKSGEDFPAMKAPSKVKEEELIEEEDPDEAEEEPEEDTYKPPTFNDFEVFSLVDDVVNVINPYDSRFGISICTFYLRGYDVVKDAKYTMMEKYIPIMLALLGGPACTVKSDNEIFMRFMRSSVDSGINVNKDKFMIFTLEREDTEVPEKVYLIYLIDQISRNIVNELWGTLQGNNEELDFFVQLGNAVLNPVVNQYGMLRTNWPIDRASQSLDTDEKIAEFCNMMGTELGFEMSHSSKTSYASAISTFDKKSVISDLKNFLKSISVALDELEKNMTPDNYVESFLRVEETPDIEEDVEPTVEKEEEPVTQVEQTQAEGDLFDDVGEAVEVPVEEPKPAKKASAKQAKKAPKKQEEVKPAKTESKPANKKFEIPVQH